MDSMIVVGIPFLLIFLIINTGIPTTHQINITVVVGILFTTMNMHIRLLTTTTARKSKGGNQCFI